MNAMQFSNPNNIYNNIRTNDNRNALTIKSYYLNNIIKYYKKYIQCIVFCYRDYYYKQLDDRYRDFQIHHKYRANI
jgi:hypothetical protein